MHARTYTRAREHTHTDPTREHKHTWIGMQSYFWSLEVAVPHAQQYVVCVCVCARALAQLKSFGRAALHALVNNTHLKPFAQAALHVRHVACLRHALLPKC